MRKIIAAIIVTTVVASVPAVHAAPFSGYSIGLNSGVNIARIQSSKLGEFPVHVGMSGKSSTKTAGLFGVQFAYEASKSNSLYWGMGLDFNFYVGDKNKQTISANQDIRKGLALWSNIKMHYENGQKWSSNLDFRLGYNFCNQAILYGLAGFKLYQDYTTLSSSYTTTQWGQNRYLQEPIYKKSRTHLSPVFGVGAAYKVTNNISLGTEYRYNLPVKRSIKHTEGGRHLLKLKTGSSHAIMGKVTYHF